jgi:acyl carrier protein
MNDLCAKLADIMDIDEIKETDTLTSFPEWDSLSILSTIAMLDSQYGVNLTASDLRQLKTVADLTQLLRARSRQ